jgi:uncharacterized protein YbjT (DUF2867 family)
MPFTGSILVFGATGTQGGAVARELLGAGLDVHAFVRDPGSAKAQALAGQGATLQQGNLDDPDSIRAALRGKHACYAVTTPFEGGSDQEVLQGEDIIAAALEVGLPWFIFASVASAEDADVPHFRSKARIEHSLRDSGLAWTVIAPSYFYENVAGATREIGEGRLSLAMPADVPLQQVGLRDLGALVLAVLSREAEHVGRRVEVAADAPTPGDMAEALGVRFEERPIGQLAARSQDLAAMYGFLSTGGYHVDIEALKRTYPEVAWASFADWATAESDRQHA